MITVGFETVRSVKLYQNDFNLTNLYSYLKLLVAAIISMLPSFRFMVSTKTVSIDEFSGQGLP